MTTLSRIPSRLRASVPKDVQDGIADLRDYCTSPTSTITITAGEALFGLTRLYELGDKGKLKHAYNALHTLKERNAETFGPDIPIDHATVYKPFRDVLDGLIDAIERDFDRELKQQLGARVR